MSQLLIKFNILSLTILLYHGKQHVSTLMTIIIRIVIFIFEVITVNIKVRGDSYEC